MKNRTGRILLEQRYGKGCFMERAGIRKITSEEEAELKRTIKGFKRLDRTITYHHIREKRNGGKVTIENGANLAAYNHEWLNQQSPQVQAEINRKLQQFKWRIDMARMEITADKIDLEKIDLQIDMGDTIEIPVFENTPEQEKTRQKSKFNRAKEKRKLERIIEEELEDMEIGD